MELIYIFLSAIAILLIVNIYFTFKAGKKEYSTELNEIKFSTGMLIQNLKDTEAGLKNEFTANRLEATQTASNLRTEIIQQVTVFGKIISDNIHIVSELQNNQFTAFSD
ncbi:hypothetical protein [Ferruginibacter sp.]|uniref:hypothetical protein n=1 Tax=Ferruginibacter sp. TaxID=1940288 RepID=UPI00265B5583|nr:hypothetical protein [Ferruginibacter sp.]